METKKPFVCPKEGCNASFPRAHRLKIHIQTHEGTPSFKCAVEGCGKAYFHKSHLKRHEAAEHGNSWFLCPFEGCEIILKTEATLRKHIDNTHLNKTDKTYKCQHCDKQFNKHHWLKSHEAKHTDIKPHMCPVEKCGKSFQFARSLKRHAKIHEGYKCTDTGCEAVLETWSLFRKHVKIAHPNVFQCEQCLKTFATSWNLREHRNVHMSVENRPVFHCKHPKCPRSFSTARNLNFHVRKYHDLRPFECRHEECHLSFKTQEAFDRHQLAHDPNVPVLSKKKTKQFRQRKRANKTALHMSGYVGKCSEASSSDEPRMKVRALAVLKERGEIDVNEISNMLNDEEGKSKSELPSTNLNTTAEEQIKTDNLTSDGISNTDLNGITVISGQLSPSVVEDSAIITESSVNCELVELDEYDKQCKNEFSESFYSSESILSDVEVCG